MSSSKLTVKALNVALGTYVHLVLYGQVGSAARTRNGSNVSKASSVIMITS